MNEDGTKARGIIAITLTSSLFAVTVALVFFEPSSTVEGYLNILLGALIAAMTTVMQFYFGSSSGAKQLVATQSDIIRASVGNAMVGTENNPATVKVDTSEAPVAVKEAKPLSMAPEPVAEDPIMNTREGKMMLAVNPTATPAELTAALAVLRRRV